MLVAGEVASCNVKQSVGGVSFKFDTQAYMSRTGAVVTSAG